MAKKTAKPTQQKTKEEQWRRRMAQQSQTGMSNVGASADVASTTLVDGETQAVAAQQTAASPSPAKRSAGAAATAQRAASSAARSSRSRLTAATMSLDEEMGYVRSDIRKLVLLSAICVAILIALAFILPSFI